MKHKVFFWLLLKDRISTRDILRRKGMELDIYTDLCIMQKMETVAHLILMCNFAKAYWRSIGALVVTTRSMPQIFDLIRRKLGVPFFMDIIILMFWSIWTVRNNWVFDGQDPQCIFASKSSCLNSLSFSRAPFLCCILLTPPPLLF
jgi:hypothetical protein